MGSCLTTGSFSFTMDMSSVIILSSVLAATGAADCFFLLAFCGAGTLNVESRCGDDEAAGGSWIGGGFGGAATEVMTGIIGADTNVSLLTLGESTSICCTVIVSEAKGADISSGSSREG